jgi:hypothetical protein
MNLKSVILSAVLLTSSTFAVSINKVVVDEKLDVIKLPNKTLNLDVGFGSGAFHYKKDSNNVFYTITDRGPNIKCKDSKKLMGEKLCEKGKIFPVAKFTPTIYKIKVYKNYYKILKKIQIKDKDGNQVSGISNAGTENAYNIHGEAIPFDPNGLDSESLIKLSDGTFWIGEEYGASIVHLSSDGKIIKRFVPAGFEKNLTNANYEVSPTLPAIIAKRPLNRGIESMAISPDEKSLYFIMQSPLANPNQAAYKKSRNVRLFKFDLANEKVIGEYIYKMDLPNTFKLDKNKKQNAVKLSEMVASANDELIVLERISNTTKFYKVKLGGENILNTKWDDLSTTPTLEETKNIKSLHKELVLDTSDINGMPKKIEGLAYINENEWILVNDNDFGIDNLPSYIVKVKK